MIEDGSLEKLREGRYAGWSGDLGKSILGGDTTLQQLEQSVASGEIDPQRASGHQEMLENLVNQHIWDVERSARS
jgi:xylose isomerase